MTSSRIIWKRKIFICFTNPIYYHVHTIYSGTLKVSTEITTAIHGFKLATNISELCFFLDWLHVYKELFPDFARTAAPLDAKLKESQPDFSELEEDILLVIGHLKETLDTPPVLALQKGEEQLLFETGVSKRYLICMLQKEQD